MKHAQSSRLVPEGESVKPLDELMGLFRFLFLLGQTVLVWGLVALTWGAAQLTFRAVNIYNACGMVFWQGDAPKCLRQFVDQKYWLDLFK